MAIIYRAELSPSKTEILQSLLEARGWAEPGGMTVLGSYRFDDPAGQVGIECHLVRSGETVFHLPLTYRDAPLEGAEDAFLGTMHHSVLGTRHLYDGLGDEVALEAFLQALCGKQEQAELDVHAEDGSLVEHRPQSVVVRLEVDPGAEPPSPDELHAGEPFTIAQTIGGLDGTVRLVATWREDEDEHSGVLAAYDDIVRSEAEA